MFFVYDHDEVLGCLIVYRVWYMCNLGLDVYKFDMLVWFDHIWLYGLDRCNILVVSDSLKSDSERESFDDIEGVRTGKRIKGSLSDEL